MYGPYNPLHEPIPKVPFHQPGLGGYGYFGEDEFGESTNWTEEILDPTETLDELWTERDEALEQMWAEMLEFDQHERREQWLKEYPLTEQPECSRGPNGEIFIAAASSHDKETRYAECPDVSKIPPCEGGWWAKERLSEGSQGQMEMVWKCPTEAERIEVMREIEMMMNETRQNLTTMSDAELLELQHSFSDSLGLKLFSQGSHHLEQQLADLLVHVDQEVYRRSNPPPPHGWELDWECPPDAICAAPTETKPTVTTGKAPSNLKRVLNTLTGKPHGLAPTEILIYSGVGLAAYLLFRLGRR